MGYTPVAFPEFKNSMVDKEAHMNFKFDFKPVQQDEDLDKSFNETFWGGHWIAYDKDIHFAYLLAEYSAARRSSTF